MMATDTATTETETAVVTSIAAEAVVPETVTART